MRHYRRRRRHVYRYRVPRPKPITSTQGCLALIKAIVSGAATLDIFWCEVVSSFTPHMSACDIAHRLSADGMTIVDVYQGGRHAQ